MLLLLVNVMGNFVHYSYKILIIYTYKLFWFKIMKHDLACVTWNWIVVYRILCYKDLFLGSLDIYIYLQIALYWHSVHHFLNHSIPNYIRNVSPLNPVSRYFYRNFHYILPICQLRWKLLKLSECCAQYCTKHDIEFTNEE